MISALVLLPIPGDEYRDDFAAIKQYIRAIDPDIRVLIFHEPNPGATILGDIRGYPTLTVSFRHRLPFPINGKILGCRFIPKIQQVRCYAAAHIAFPRSRVFQWNLKLDPAQWGRFVVIKPMRPGTMSRGNINLIPTAMIERLTPQQFVPGHPMLVQSYIDTGERPTHYRVLTLLGEPLYALAIVLKQRRPDLNAPLRDILSASVATNSGPRDLILIDDREVLDFARRMSRALPDVPLQGLDIIREHQTGRLFALESNPGGNTWHFSSKYAAKSRQLMGNGREKLLNHFGALEIAARALVGAVHEHAA
jgi:hypothetical protein